jgi:hypothetical protein
LSNYGGISLFQANEQGAIWGKIPEKPMTFAVAVRRTLLPKHLGLDSWPIREFPPLTIHYFFVGIRSRKVWENQPQDLAGLVRRKQVLQA